MRASHHLNFHNLTSKEFFFTYREKMIYCNFPPNSPSFSLWGNGNHMTDLFLYLKMIIMTFVMTQTVKMLPTIGGTRFSSLGQEDLLEKEMAAYSSILAWKIPCTKEPGRLQSMESQKNKIRICFSQELLLVHGVTKNQTQLSN